MDMPFHGCMLAGPSQIPNGPPSHQLSWKLLKGWNSQPHLQESKVGWVCRLSIDFSISMTKQGYGINGGSLHLLLIQGHWHIASPEDTWSIVGAQ